ncbi:MAG: Fe-S cluster assembly protein HesB [Methanoregula sp.]|nr:Fe-S cluster assembly protein HesB [Methanoregula sp.]
MSVFSSIKIQQIVMSLAGHYGEIAWWPGNTDEVMIGSILTQQTRWENVERALLVLEKRGLSSMHLLYSADKQDIEEAIRCTGFYRIKAQRLQSLAAHVMETYGGVEGMHQISTETLRDGLLAVKGIGEETADSILCFGFLRTSFVIDAYTERIVRCAGVKEKRQELKPLFERILPDDPKVYRQAHAHLVEYAKEFCGKKRCSECILVNLKG